MIWLAVAAAVLAGAGLSGWSRGWLGARWALLAVLVGAACGGAAAALALAKPAPRVPWAWELEEDARRALIAAGASDREDAEGKPALDLEVSSERFPKRSAALVRLRIRSSKATPGLVRKAFDPSGCAFGGATGLAIEEKGAGRWEIAVTFEEGD